MVAIAPIGIGVIAAAIIAILAKPRLPTFSFKILKLYPTLLHDSTPAINVGAEIKLHNSNFITAAVHAFTFDMYYPDWEDKLQYIGQVTDTRQKAKPVAAEESATKKSKRRSKKDAIWVLAPRKDFEIIDDVLMVPTNAGSKVFSNLAWEMYQKSAVVQVPLSGVFHIMANGKIPASMSMICENNLLDAYNMEFEGISCHLDFVGPGWIDLDAESARLRSKLEDSTWRASDYPIPEALIA